MGHERVGILPRTKKWNDLIKDIELIDSAIPAALIASQTLQNVRQRFQSLAYDSAVNSAFQYLVIFARACRAPNPQKELITAGIALPDEPSVFSVVKSLRDYVQLSENSTEYEQLALASAADAVGSWYHQNKLDQLSLFEASPRFFDSCKKLGNGSGFCELARNYFGKLTERYLNYFLDRAASAYLPSLRLREQFRCEINNHVDNISKHAFETSKITQSFAAGWFNKHTRDKNPPDKEIQGFLGVAFGKLQDELRREEEAG